MSAVDVLVRVQTLCKKYEAYTNEDVQQQASSTDNFSVLYAAISAQVEDVITVGDLHTDIAASFAHICSLIVFC